MSNQPPKHCECCGEEPKHKQTRQLEWIEATREWTCDVCIKKNELPPAQPKVEQ